MKYDFDQVIERKGTDSAKWGKYPQEVLPLWVADMDFVTSQMVIDALQQKVKHGIFGYIHPAAELRRVIQERIKNLYRWQIGEEELVFLPGLVNGLNLSIQAFTFQGEGVLVQPPVYPHFFRDPMVHGRVVMDPPLAAKNDSYEIDFELFEKSITEKTKIFLLCNPHNPVGRVYTIQELEKLAEICLRHHLIICSDEIHNDLIYPDYRHLPIATLSPEVAHYTVTLMSPSKTFNLAGLGFGFAIIQNPKLLKIWQKTSLGILPGVNIMGHAAALAAYQEGQEWLDQVLIYLKGNRDFLQQYLNHNLPNIKMCRMEATYLAWLDCRHAGIPGNPYEFFLKEAKVALSDGAMFGRGGEGFIRLNFACPRKNLHEALGRMSASMNKI